MQKTAPQTILVTDDTEQNRYMFSRFLTKAGFEVLEASTGREALELVNKNPSLVILDVKLPDINGFEVCRRIKSNKATAGIPVIHVSSTFQGLQHRVQGLDGGADGYIATPVEPEELIATVNAFLRIRQAESVAQQYQKRLAIAQKAARIGSFEWDLATDEVSWTQELELLYGLKPGEQPRTRAAWQKMIHPDDLAATVERVARSIERGEDFQAEYRIFQPDGELKWILSRAEVIRDDAGKAIRIVGVNIDITDRKRDEEKLREAQTRLRDYADELEQRVRERTAKLEETIQDLEAFSYSVSHDLCTPLRAMQWYSYHLMEEGAPELGEPSREFLRRIVAAASRLEHLIQDVLMYSRVVRADVQLVPIDLDELIRELIPQYPEFEKAGVVIKIESPLAGVQGQKSFLTQCISNILDNAVKFVAPAAVPHIKIYTTQVGGEVRLNIRDNGIGIEPRHYTRIFQMFERLEPNEKYAGTGIGLAVVKKSVERMGGKVGLESEVGKGSVFWLQLQKAS